MLTWAIEDIRATHSALRRTVLPVKACGCDPGGQFGSPKSIKIERKLAKTHWFAKSNWMADELSPQTANGETLAET